MGFFRRLCEKFVEQKIPPKQFCPECGDPLPPEKQIGRRRVFCSPKCRKRSFRRMEPKTPKDTPEKATAETSLNVRVDKLEQEMRGVYKSLDFILDEIGIPSLNDDG